MNIQFFVCFHNRIYHENYHFEEKDKKYITFYGVRERQTVDRVIYENELAVYNPHLQKQTYNEGSCLYHVFHNNLYQKYDYVGFAQYDMTFYPNVFRDIERTLETQPKTIFYIGFFEWAFKGGQSLICHDYDHLTGGLKSYNRFFNTNFVEKDLIRNKMIICNTFLIPKDLFAKMMSWMNFYFINNISPVMCDQRNQLDFNPGHMIEALTSMFLSLEIPNGYTYHPLQLTHK